MPSLFKKALQLYARADQSVAGYFERKGLGATGAMLRSTPIALPVLVVVSPLLAIGAGMPLTALTIGFSLVAGAVGAAVTIGAMAGATYIGEKQDQRDKLITMTTTNTAGQRVEGSVYDLARLQECESRIATLSAQLDKKDDPAVREQLTKTFEGAASYIRRVRVVTPSADAPDATTYTFARKAAVTQVVTAP